MSDKEYKDLSKKIDTGLQLAEKRMLHEKALRGECVVVCDKNNNIQHIPARQVIAENRIFQ
ncbi:MAG: histidine kinase [Prevotella sp.]|nr:histidine kinase [Prevotella sp.]